MNSTALAKSEINNRPISNSINGVPIALCYTFCSFRVRICMPTANDFFPNRFLFCFHIQDTISSRSSSQSPASTHFSTSPLQCSSARSMNWRFTSSVVSGFFQPLLGIRSYILSKIARRPFCYLCKHLFSYSIRQVGSPRSKATRRLFIHLSQPEIRTNISNLLSRLMQGYLFSICHVSQ